MTQSLQHCLFATKRLALCNNHLHMVTTWACNFPKKNICYIPKCVLRCICDNRFVRTWAPFYPSLPTDDLYCKAHCDCQKNTNICICTFSYSCMNDTQTSLHTWPPSGCVRLLLWELKQINPFSHSSGMSLVSQLEALMTSRYASGLAFPPPTLTQNQTNR